jgi:hypothetical protein
MRNRHQNRWLAALLLIAGMLAAGCAAQAQAAPDDNPAQVEPIAGSDRSQVVLSQEGAQRVGIHTEPIATSVDANGAVQSVIPLAAVMYDQDGKTWTYTTSEPLTFIPQEVVIARIDHDTAILQAGPAPGTQVVTVGAAELFGAEYGVPGE